MTHNPMFEEEYDEFSDHDLLEYQVDKDGKRLESIPPPSEDFLTELTTRARRYGWSGDYIEVRNFVENLYKQAKLEVPDLEPYEWKR